MLELELFVAGLVVSAGLGAFLGFVGGHGWTSAAMGGKHSIEVDLEACGIFISEDILHNLF